MVYRYGKPDFERRDWTPMVDVREFHRVFGAPLDAPDTDELRVARNNLVEEEMVEVLEELQEGDDLAPLAKELADAVYVLYGTAAALGIDLDWAVHLVHMSNLTKLGPDGKPVVRADGKVMKGPDYVPPNMRPALPRTEELA